jgi:hypothetical protein
MPLHDWNNLEGWEGVHQYWLTDLARSVKPQLPSGYRAYLGSAPKLTIGQDNWKPDVAVRHWEVANGSPTPQASQEMSAEPETQVAVTIALDPELAVHVTNGGRLVAAIELVSPRNKDRPSSRETYLIRYLGYLKWGVNLMLVDVHPRPFGFSFADALTEELQVKLAPLAAPMAIVYRVEGPTPDGGSFVGLWRRQLVVGEPLPVLPLPLSNQSHVVVDLEGTYGRATADAYIS